MASLLLDQLLEDYATWCGVRTGDDFDLLERLRLGLWLLSPTLLRHVSVLPDNDAWYLGALLTDDPGLTKCWELPALRRLHGC
tara:strand:+ start:504 stop:752 length:249 start_codon:yes stop_codon:yes gene_type:complete